MATFNKFQQFVEELAKGGHVFGTDQLAVALTNTLPVNTNTVLANITQIAYTNLSSRNVTTSSAVQTAGTFKLVCADLTLTASGVVPTFRYVVLYNDTTVGDKLIGWYDYGSGVDMANNETFTIDFDGTNGVLTLV